MKILFFTTNGKGIGHLSRCLNIAESIRLVSSDAFILFVTNASTNVLLDKRQFPAILLPPKYTPDKITDHYQNQAIPSNLNNKFLRGIIEVYKPNVVVYDYHVNLKTLIQARAVGAKNVLIFREMIKEKQSSLLVKNGVLPMFDKIIVPHTEMDFDSIPIADDTMSKMVFVGPIVTQINEGSAETAQQLRIKYRLDKYKFIITATMGGGGYIAESKAFADSLIKSQTLLTEKLEGLLIILVTGPFFNHTLKPNNNLIIVDYEPEIVTLFSMSDLVVSQAGYNTINEIISSKSPSILLPSGRSQDDQYERARKLQATGCATICDNSDELSNRIYEILTNGHDLQRMKRSLETCVIEPGNQRAANEILSIASVGNISTRNNIDSVSSDLSVDKPYRMFIEQYSSAAGLIEEVKNKYLEGYNIFRLIVLDDDIFEKRKDDIAKLVKYPVNEKLGVQISIIRNEKHYSIVNSSFSKYHLMQISTDLHVKRLHIRIACECCDVKNCSSGRCGYKRMKFCFSIEKLVDIVRQAKALGAESIVFDGCGSTFQSYVTKGLAIARQSGLKIVVSTHEVMFHDAKFAEEIAKCFPDTFILTTDGTDSCSLGLKDERHKQLESILQTIVLNQKGNESNSIAVRINIDKLNLHQIADTIPTLAHYEVMTLILNLVWSNGEGSNKLNIDELREFYHYILPKALLAAKECGIKLKVYPFYFDLMERYSETIGLCPEHAMDICTDLKNRNYDTELSEFARGNYGKLFYQSVRCFAPNDSICITSEGDVYPCLTAMNSSKYVLGSVLLQDLSEIFQTDRIRLFQQESGRHDICNTCIYRMYSNFQINSSLLRGEK